MLSFGQLRFCWMIIIIYHLSMTWNMLHDSFVCNWSFADSLFVQVKSVIDYWTHHDFFNFMVSLFTCISFALRFLRISVCHFRLFLLITYWSESFLVLPHLFKHLVSSCLYIYLRFFELWYFNLLIISSPFGLPLVFDYHLSFYLRFFLFFLFFMPPAITIYI